jgi:hypothetical protein
LRATRFLLILFLTGVAVAAWLWHTGRVVLPDRWNPWAPLAIAAPPDAFFRLKLARASRDGAACRTLLHDAGLRFRPLADRSTGQGCGFADAVRVERTSLDLGASLDMSCRLALSFALWERHALQPAAQAHFGAPVVRLQHLGSYACRTIGGGKGGTRSRHATADAIDIAGFVFADGRRVTVARDWTHAGAPGDFLGDVFAGGCRFFDGALGPRYNAAHRDHLHFDRGDFRVCR